MSGLELETVTSAERLGALTGEWQALCTRARRATPFQRPEWVLPWWRQFGAGELMTIAAWQHGALVALAPLYRRPDGIGAFVGTGNTDRVDVLIDDAAGDTLADALLARLAAPTSPDEWDLFPIAAGSPLVRAAAPGSWEGTQREHDVHPCLTLPPRGGELAGVVSARRLKKLYAARRQIAAVGTLTIERADSSSATEGMAALATLHGARWRARGSAGVMDDAAIRFHGDVAVGMARAGLLRLYLLRVAGRVAAAFYGLATADALYYYLGGFSPELARYSPGSLIVLHAIERAIDDGVCTFDFLNGDEPYKYAWGAAPRPLYRWRLSRRANARAVLT